MISQLLEDTQRIVERYEEKSERTGEGFNIFSILRMERNEVGTHSRILHELLSPKGCHGKGDIFLKLFLAEVLGIDASGPLVVRREDSTEEGRRIDLTIQGPGVLVGIEVKLDAADQRAQLYDYREELLNRQKMDEPINFLYLTLSGRDPDPESLASRCGKKSIEKDQFTTLSFREDVVNWLEECLVVSQATPALNAAIQQYKVLIENLTGMRKRLTMEIATRLLDDVNSLSLALKIGHSIPEAKTQVQEMFWEDLYARLLAEKKHPEFYSQDSSGRRLTARKIAQVYYGSSRKNKRIGIRYKINDDLYGCINLFNIIHYGLKFDGKTCGGIARDEVKASLRAKLVSIKGNALADEKSEWLSSFYNDQTEDKIDFDAFNSNAIDLLDSKNRAAIISSIVSHLASLEALVLGLDETVVG